MLGAIRNERGFSIRQVTVRSRDAFKPWSIVSYERGERTISLERLISLAAVYGVAAEEIVAAISRRLSDAGLSGPFDRSLVALSAARRREDEGRQPPRG